MAEALADTKPEGIDYRLEDEGLTIIMTGKLADGREVTANIGWDDIATAQANYQNAIDGFKVRLFELDGNTAFSDLETGVRDSIRKLFKIGSRQVVLFTSVGGTPWKYPKFRFTATERNAIEVGAGWLKGCFFIGVGRPNAH